LPRYGIVGVAIAWSVRTVVDAALLVGASRLLLPQSREAVGRMARWLTAATIGIALVALVPGTSTRLALAAILTPSWLAVAWWMILTPEERSAPGRMLAATAPDGS
jgi:hypothetical protein